MQETFKIVENWLPLDVAEQIYANMLQIQDWEARVCDKTMGPRIVSPFRLQELGLTPVEYAKSAPSSLQELAAGGTMAYLFFVKSLREFNRDLLADWNISLVDLACRETGIENTAKHYLEEPQVTMYTSGCFLGQHSDGVGDRQVAFVANFTKNWQPDFGGCLTILDKGRWSVIEPKFNSLVLLNVRNGSAHYVSQVSSWVKHGRYAITGWVGKARG